MRHGLIIQIQTLAITLIYFWRFGVTSHHWRGWYLKEMLKFPAEPVCAGNIQGAKISKKGFIHLPTKKKNNSQHYSLVKEVNYMGTHVFFVFLLFCLTEQEGEGITHKLRVSAEAGCSFGKTLHNICSVLHPWQRCEI